MFLPKEYEKSNAYIFRKFLFIFWKEFLTFLITSTLAVNRFHHALSSFKCFGFCCPFEFG
ncbi:unnamed protein product [Larinioides sclopetarius]|uniref:Uncharacterized protein n=1 Tax=Larinioides sclopetarius TaxID=280406 RepID=A0AAV1YZ82_9ARAC